MIRIQLLFIATALLVSSCAESQSNLKSDGQDSGSAKSSTTSSVFQSKEKEAVKQAAIQFLRWDDKVWEGENVAVAPGARKFLNTIILDVKGRPDDQCPCKINWQSVEKVISWMKVKAPVISNQYLSEFRKEMKKLEPYLNKTHNNIEGEPPYSAFHFSVGNGGLPALDNTDIYKNSAVWDIDFTNDSVASVNITFQLPKDWNSGIAAYSFKMINEKGFWKVASNMDEGIINPTYRIK